MKIRFTSKDPHLWVNKSKKKICLHEFYWDFSAPVWPHFLLITLSCQSPIGLLCNALLLLVCTIYFLVIVSHFETRIGDEFVILGNDALMKCQAPSFVSDFLSVTGWVDERLQNLKSSAKGKIWGNHWREKMMMIMALEWYSSNLLHEANFGKGELKKENGSMLTNCLCVPFLI